MPLDPLQYSDSVVRVYERCVDELLVNLAKHFNVSATGNTASWNYEIMMLSKLGAVRRESAAIIAKMVAAGEPAIEEAVRAAMIEAIEENEPDLKKAALNGLLNDVQMDAIDGIQSRLQAFSRQAKSQLNLVNTTMLESTADAFRQGVSAANDIIKQMNAAQDVLNVQTGMVHLGTKTHQEALRAAVKAMSDAGITGFIDRAGRKWSAEAYVRMNIQTTCGRAANQAVMDRNASYGNDIVWPRTNATARPGCYPWQGQLISMSNVPRDVQDGKGESRHVYAASETTYGQPAGIWGINCHHFPMNVFIPNYSYVRGEENKLPQAENDRLYQLTQEQRRLERRVRYAKRDAAMYKAAGDEVLSDHYSLIARARSAKLREFVKQNSDVLVYDAGRTWVAGSTQFKKALKQQQKNARMRKANNPYGFPAITWKHGINDDIGKPDKPMCNPLFSSKKWEYTHNCQRCIQAYEFRRRGYDVIAKGKPKDGNNIRFGSECFVDSNGKSAQFTFFQTAARVKKELSSAPDGARYGIYVKWKRSYGSGAHVYVAEIENGTIRYVDPQSGKTDASDYFEKGSSGHFGFLRLDDKQITSDMAVIAETMEVRAK